MIARGVQPIDVTNSMYQGAGLQLEQQRANAFDQRNAMLDQRWQQENQQGQDAQAKAERARMKKEPGPMLYQEIKAGDRRALEIARAMAIEDFPQLGEMPPEMAEQAIMQSMEQTYGPPPAPQVHSASAVSASRQAAATGSDL
jgi:hypothetical protein